VVRLWEVVTGRQRWMRPRERPIAVLSFSPDGRMLVVGANRIALVLRVSDGAPLHELSGHHGKIVAASFSPDGRMLVTASADKTARIWDTAAGTLLHTLSGHRAQITSASFSPDGRLVVTTSFDHDSLVWVAATGRQLWRLRQAAVVNGADFSADSRWLVTAGPSGGVWKMSNGSNLYLLRPREPLLTAVEFSPAGWRIVTGGIDGSVRTYSCQLCGGVEQLVVLARARLAHLRR
jgi:WD40 repeat protein